MKNVVLMPWIEREETVNSSGIGRADRTKGYKYGVDSWKQWCEKHDVEFFLMDELLVPESEMVITWQRWYVLEILEKNGIEYDQVLLVDADCIPHPNCPNMFDISDRKFCFVHNDGSYDWILRSIENYSKYFFDGYMIPWHHYFDSGMIIFNKDHKKFFADILNFFHENRENLLEVESKWHAGTDQTPVNFLTHLLNIDYKLLPYEYNMTDLFRKELLDDRLLFTDIGWIYQYNSIPNNVDDRLTFYWMEKTYNHLWGDK